MQKTMIGGTVSSVKELKQVGDNQVFNFSIAVSNGKNQDGSWRDSTFWDCAIWGKRAESVSRFLTVKTKVVAIGRPSARAHDGKAYLQLTVDDFTLLGGGDTVGGEDARTSPVDTASNGTARYDDSDPIPF